MDVARAVQQWSASVEALREAGWGIVEVPPADECPDSVFVEDTVVVFRDLAVLARPGAERRRGETAGAEAAVRALGLRVARITAPGTLDGGDVLQVGDTVYVGQSGRTNAEGARQLAAHLEPLGAAVVPVPIRRALHLKTALTALPDGTLIGYAPWLDDVSRLAPLVSMPEPGGANVVLLGGERVLLAAGCAASEAVLRRRGLQPVTVDLSELEKLEGGVTCLSVRLPG